MSGHEHCYLCLIDVNRYTQKGEKKLINVFRYTTEEQAFWLLHVLVDRICPGYYSTSMYGALLDQIIFEQLVKKTMPMLWDHFKKTEVELSIACLPWFLSLYVNSMPLECAVRVLDILFMEGPRILFQIG